MIGIDASRWQGVLPASQLFDAGIHFAIVKATHGLGTNPDVQFVQSFRALLGYPIARSAYHWLTDADPVKQAEHFVRVVEAAGYRDDDLMLAVDFEEPSTALRGGALLRHLLACLRRVRQLTGGGMMYSGRWYLDQFVALEDGPEVEELLTYPYWHAEYPRTAIRDRRACGIDPPVLAAPHLPAAWAKRGRAQALWQFDGDGGCLLPNGVDADFNRFDGDPLALRAALGRPVASDDPDTIPQTPTSKSSQRLRAVREPIVTTATPLRAGEGEHTVPLEDVEL